MFITIADLWESLNISQSIPQNSPIIDSPLLNVPLSFFRTEEYLNLLILLYLYSHHLIDDFNIIHQEKFIGKISFDQIQLFYSAIREAIKPALINSLHKVENKEPIKTPNNASQWINKAQITQYTQVFYKSIYMTLSKYTQLHVSMTTNPFLCRIFYNSDNNSILINAFDSMLMMQLCTIANERQQDVENIAPSASPGILATDSYKNCQKTTFFESNSPLKVQENFDVYQLRFNKIKAQIQNPQLHKEVSLNNVRHYKQSNLVNYGAIAEFISNYGFLSTKEPSSVLNLKKLFEVIDASQAHLNAVIAEMVKNKFFSDTKSESLDSRITQLHQTLIELKSIERLNSIIPPSEEQQLRIKWNSFQQKIYGLLTQGLKPQVKEPSVESASCSM